jgi:methanogenic corrinoid protein MtbC1
MHATTFFAALTTGTGEAPRAQIERLIGNGADPVDVCDRVLAPALHAVGERWADGNMSIAHEHRASATVQAIVAAIAPAFSMPGPRRGIAVVATAVHTKHSIGASMVAGALRADRFVVHDLGADLPINDLVAFAEAERADLVALSCPDLTSLPAVHATVGALTAVDIPVILGGAGIDARTTRSFGAFGYGQSLREAQKLARSAVADRRAGRPDGLRADARRSAVSASRRPRGIGARGGGPPPRGGRRGPRCCRSRAPGP